MPQVDSVDKQILNILAKNCRTPYREIAKSLGISTTAIKGRVDDLVSGGVISEFIVRFSPAMIDCEVLLLWLKTDGQEDKTQFISEIGKNRGVIQVSPLYGGDYLVAVEYTSTLEMATVTEAIKSNPHVNYAEDHTILMWRGKKTNLTNIQLRVLNALVKDARMQTTDIARESGLTVRMVRKALREIRESEAIDFTLRWRLNVGERLTVLLKLKWDPKQISRDEVIDIMTKDYPDRWWEIIPSASEPVLFAAMTVDNMNQVDTITTNMKIFPGIIYSDAFTYRPSHNFKGLRRLLLEEAVQAAGVR